MIDIGIFLNHTKTKKDESEDSSLLLVGLPGFEPGQTEPKPVVLPLHHSPIIMCFPRKAMQR